MTYQFHAACSALRLDPGHLPIRDRAVLRILNRCHGATAAQLAVLAYRNRHYAQIRLRRLWDAGFLEPRCARFRPRINRASPAYVARARSRTRARVLCTRAADPCLAKAAARSRHTERSDSPRNVAPRGP